MSTTVRDPKKLRLAQAHLALNGWVGTLPIASVSPIDALAASLQKPAKICTTASATEGQPAPLSCEPDQHQD